MPHSPLDRIKALVPDDTIGALIELSGADYTTLLMDVARQRAGRVQPTTVLRRYRSDRFVQPAVMDLAARNRVEAYILAALPSSFATVVLAPLVPFGTHASLAAIHQDRLVSTARNTEVAGDPTAGLALEAAVRRRALLADDAKSPERVRLASLQQITRAQRFDGPLSWAHFDAFGMVTAGRDEGHDAFEIDSLTEHVEILSGAVLALGARRVTVSFTDFAEGKDGRTISAAMDRIDHDERVILRRDPKRQAGRGYYQGSVFNITCDFGPESFDVGDGGFVDWSQQLVGSRKERLMTSGLGVDRLAWASAPRD